MSDVDVRYDIDEHFQARTGHGRRFQATAGGSASEVRATAFKCRRLLRACIRLPGRYLFDWLWDVLRGNATRIPANHSIFLLCLVMGSWNHFRTVLVRRAALGS